MNKLKQNLFTKRSWGGEVIWALTDDYMVKTIEIDKGKKTPFIIHELKEKSIIVVTGILYLHYGECGSNEEINIQKLKVGYSWHIDPTIIHRYEAEGKNLVRLIEVSTPQLDEGFMLLDDGTVIDKNELEEKEKITKEIVEDERDS